MLKYTQILTLELAPGSVSLSPKDSLAWRKKELYLEAAIHNCSLGRKLHCNFHTLENKDSRTFLAGAE